MPTATVIKPSVGSRSNKRANPEKGATVPSHPTLHYLTDMMAARLPRVVIVIHSSPSSSQLPASVPMVSRSDE